jgi:1-acyl-sn-glycerol-3-phosphate acyltransferase
MKTSNYDCACDIDQSLVNRLRRFPREPDMVVYGVRALIALIIRGWLRIYHRFEIVGHENLRTNRSLVIVANHSSHLDTLCLLAALPLRKLHRAFPAAAADYFFQSVPRTFIAAVVTNALPFARRVRVRRSLSLCSELLNDPENILIIFPEGTRSETGSSRGGTSRFCRAICRALFGRGRRAGICRVQEKFDSLLGRPAVIRHAKQIRSTSAQSQRNCITL